MNLDDVIDDYNSSFPDDRLNIYLFSGSELSAISALKNAVKSGDRVTIAFKKKHFKPLIRGAVY